MQLKVQTFLDFIRQRITIPRLGSFIRQLRQIIGFEFDTIQLVVSAQFLDLRFRICLTQDNIPVFIPRELVKQILLCQFLPITFFRSKVFGNIKSWHNRSAVNTIEFNLICYFQRITQSIRDIAENLIHLGSCLHPLLFRITHTIRIIQILSRTQADQAIVRICILFVDEMHIIGSNNLDTMFMGQFNQDLIDFYLMFIYSLVGIRSMCLMTL